MLGLLLTVLCIAQGAEKKKTEPLAVVLNVSGDVSIVRAGGKKREPAKSGASLNQGDAVKASKNSRATLVLSDGKTIDVAALKTFTVTPPTSKNGNGKLARELFGAVKAKLRDISDNSEKGAVLAPTVRGNNHDTLTLVHPRRFEDMDGKPVPAFVRADAPTFVWTHVAGASSYRFVVMDGGRTLFDKTLGNADLKSLRVGRMVIFRPTVSDLVAGRSYSWRVEASNGQSTKKAESASFTVLAAESAERINDALTGLGSQNAANGVVRGAFLESNHLFADAVAEYVRAIAADPQPVYRHLLADLLDRSELYQLANVEYRAARDAGK
jgi:hypothetical protein